MEKTFWLKCSVVPGYWTNEYAIVSTTADGSRFSLFVPSEFVTVYPSSDKGLVRVQLLDSKGDLSLISLPGNPLERSSTIKVHSNQLTEAA
jgi:hypothetical protein